VDTSTSFNPIGDDRLHSQPPTTRTAGNGHEQQVAWGLANELKERIEKKEMNKRKRNEFDATDAGYINNQRNKWLNETISRSYNERTHGRD
jgi:hypothetical protein